MPLPHLEPGLIRPQELVMHCRKPVTIFSLKNFLIAFGRHLKKATFCLIKPIFGLKEGRKNVDLNSLIFLFYLQQPRIRNIYH